MGHDHREGEKEMTKEIITGLIMCIIILETVSVAEANWYLKCVDKCINKCQKRCFLILCDAGCRFGYCSPPGLLSIANGKSPGEMTGLRNDPSQTNLPPNMSPTMPPTMAN